MATSVSDINAVPADRRSRDVVRTARRRSSWRTLGVWRRSLASFSVWAIADDGWDLFFQRVFDGLDNGVHLPAWPSRSCSSTRRRGRQLRPGRDGDVRHVHRLRVADELGIARRRCAIVLAMALSAIGAAGIERVADPARSTRRTTSRSRIVTLSLFLILNAIAGVIWGFDRQAIPPACSRSGRNERSTSSRVRGSSTPSSALDPRRRRTVAVIAILLAAQDEDRGWRSRCVATAWSRAGCSGIHIGRTLQFGWALAAAAGTLAGWLVARHDASSRTSWAACSSTRSPRPTLGGLDSLGGAGRRHPRRARADDGHRRASRPSAASSSSAWRSS